jgi:hypothetical protein
MREFPRSCDQVGADRFQQEGRSPVPKGSPGTDRDLYYEVVARMPATISIEEVMSGGIDSVAGSIRGQGLQITDVPCSCRSRRASPASLPGPGAETQQLTPGAPICSGEGRTPLGRPGGTWRASGTTETCRGRTTIVSTRGQERPSPQPERSIAGPPTRPARPSPGERGAAAGPAPSQTCILTAAHRSP